jgi:hypothetical protein
VQARASEGREEGREEGGREEVKYTGNDDARVSNTSATR